MLSMIWVEYTLKNIKDIMNALIGDKADMLLIIVRCNEDVFVIFY